MEQIIPAPFRQDPINKPGVVSQPIGVCAGNHGEIYILDRNPAVLWRAQLHNPLVLVQLSTGELKQPHGLAFNSGVLFVADTGNNRIVYFDLGGTTRINPTKMTPTQLRVALRKLGMHPVELDAALKPALVRLYNERTWPDEFPQLPGE